MTEKIPPLERAAREAGLDETIEQTFPASDPPSSIPNPCEYELVNADDTPGEGQSEPKGHLQPDSARERSRPGR